MCFIKRTSFIISPREGFEELTEVMSLAVGDQLVGGQVARNDDPDWVHYFPFPPRTISKRSALALAPILLSPKPSSRTGTQRSHLGTALGRHKAGLMLNAGLNALPINIRHPYVKKVEE
jgi:hypothetical protein